MLLMMVIVSSSMSTVPVVRAGRSGVRFLVSVRHFVLRRNVQVGSGIRPLYFLKNTNNFSPGGKAEGL